MTNTKDRILAAAIRLFNEQGTGAVSTNHIAEGAGLSPGNLYYHFHNKEEIIRAIFERLFTAWDVTLVLPDDRLPTFEDVEGLVRANFRIMWDFRFVYREILALLRQDAQLRDRYTVIRQRGYEGFGQIVAVLTAVGMLTVPDEETVTRLADLCWLISEFWLTEVEVSGQAVGPEQMERGITLMNQVLQPYIHP